MTDDKKRIGAIVKEKALGTLEPRYQIIRPMLEIIEDIKWDSFSKMAVYINEKLGANLVMAVDMAVLYTGNDMAGGAKSSVFHFIEMSAGLLVTKMPDSDDDE
ncbi:MAG: hypothetical protein ACYDCO_16000 [Armatimonadota bacterium]